MTVPYKPQNFQDVIPYLVLSKAEEELAFVQKVFHAKVAHITRDPQGQIAHAEVRIGDSVVMMAQGSEQWPPMPTALYIYLPDVDAAYQRALAAGATSTWPLEDKFYGDRNAGVRTASGMQWWIATRIEELSGEELASRAAAEYKRRALQA